jgi:dTMP kinase
MSPRKTTRTTPASSTPKPKPKALTRQASTSSTKKLLPTAPKTKVLAPRTSTHSDSKLRTSTPSGKKGRLIVIDGIDGAGKATQTKLLVEALKGQGKKVETIDFPRYYNNFFGALIGECLRGDHGNFAELSPKIASILYACDRMESSVQIKAWLAEGKTVVIDRFVSSNQIHQGGKCKTDTERKEFLHWLDTMEHDILGVPRPDMIVYLNLPIAVSQTLLQKAKSKEAAQATDFKKRYMKGKTDVVEENIEYMENSRQSALKIIKSKNNWKKIDCYVRGSLRSIEDIHSEVLRIVGGM